MAHELQSSIYGAYQCAPRYPTLWSLSLDHISSFGTEASPLMSLTDVAPRGPRGNECRLKSGEVEEQEGSPSPSHRICLLKAQ